MGVLECMNGGATVFRVFEAQEQKRDIRRQREARSQRRDRFTRVNTYEAGLINQQFVGAGNRIKLE
jgi:hypothetical protein